MDVHSMGEGEVAVTMSFEGVGNREMVVFSSTWGRDGK